MGEYKRHFIAAQGKEEKTLVITNYGADQPIVINTTLLNRYTETVNERLYENPKAADDCGESDSYILKFGQKNKSFLFSERSSLHIPIENNKNNPNLS